MEVVTVTSPTFHEEPSVELARRLRYRREVDRLDYLRTVRALASSMRQDDIAKHLGITQPAVSATLRKARALPEVLAGFSGATPYEIAERYAASQIDRDRMLDELCRWEYAPSPATDGLDWLTEDVPGTTAEVFAAWRDGLIDEDAYVAIGQALAARRQTAPS